MRLRAEKLWRGWRIFRHAYLTVNERVLPGIVALILLLADEYVSQVIAIDANAAAQFFFTAAQVLGTILGFMIAIMIFRIQDLDGKRRSLINDVVSKCQDIDILFATLGAPDLSMREDLKIIRRECLDLISHKVTEFDESTTDLKNAMNSVLNRMKFITLDLELRSARGSFVNDDAIITMKISHDITYIALNMRNLVHINFHASSQELLAASIRSVTLITGFALVFGVLCITAFRMEPPANSPIPCVAFVVVALITTLYRLTVGVDRTYRSFERSWELPKGDWLRETPFT